MDLKNGIMKYRVVFAEGRGVAWDDRGAFNAKRGSVEEWARENLGCMMSRIGNVETHGRARLVGYG